MCAGYGCDRAAVLRGYVWADDARQGAVVAFNAHDVCCGNAQVARAEIAHAYEISSDEGIFRRDERVQSGLRVGEHVVWIEE